MLPDLVSGGGRAGRSVDELEDVSPEGFEARVGDFDRGFEFHEPDFGDG